MVEVLLKSASYLIKLIPYCLQTPFIITGLNDKAPSFDKSSYTGKISKVRNNRYGVDRVKPWTLKNIEFMFVIYKDPKYFGNQVYIGPVLWTGFADQDKLRLIIQNFNNKSNSKILDHFYAPHMCPEHLWTTLLFRAVVQSQAQ